MAPLSILRSPGASATARASDAQEDNISRFSAMLSAGLEAISFGSAQKGAGPKVVGPAEGQSVCKEEAVSFISYLPIRGSPGLAERPAIDV
jgi:hypothetical protein